MPDYSCPVSGTIVSCTVVLQPGAHLFGTSRCLPSAAVFLFRTHDMCDCLVFGFLRHDKKMFWWSLITNYCKKLQWQQFPCLSMACLQDKCRSRHGGSTWSLLIWIELSLLLHLLHRSWLSAETFVHTETFVHHWRSGLPLSHLSHTGTSPVWFDASFSTSKTCIQTNCQMSRPFWFLSFVLVMCVMCESQRNRIPSWKKKVGVQFCQGCCN